MEYNRCNKDAINQKRMGINQAKGESLKLSSRKLIAEITIAYINAQAEQEQ